MRKVTPKQKKTKYRFLRTISYSPLGDREYGAGEIHDLSGWQNTHVQTALQAGQIEAVEEVVVEASDKDRKEE